MKCITMGTSAGDPTLTRYNTSVAYQAGDDWYLVDAGDPALALLKRNGIDFLAVKAVFITHTHYDHMGNLPAILKAYYKYHQPGQQLKVFLPDEKSFQPLKDWTQFFNVSLDDSCFDFHFIRQGTFYSNNHLSIDAIATRHRRPIPPSVKPICFAFAITLKEKGRQSSVLHCGDLCADLSDFPSVAFEKTYDLALCELTHYQPQNAVPLFKKAGFKKLVLHHPAPKWDNDVAREQLALIFHDVPYPIIYAQDGSQFEL